MTDVVNSAKVEKDIERFQAEFLGLDCLDPVLTFTGNREKKRRVYLDSGATTLMAKAVWDGLSDYLSSASANSHTEAHRAGRDTTIAIEDSREAVGKLVGYDSDRDVVLFTSNGATGATNFLARALFPPELRFLLKRFPCGAPAELVEQFKLALGSNAVKLLDGLLERPKIVTTEMEHHSNLLPWIEAVGHHNVEVIRVGSDGTLDLAAFQAYMDAEGDQVRLVAVTGLSNVTGIMNPVHQLARITHQFGAQILVDGAQWVPHARVRMHTGDPQEAIDYLVLSGHKLYAPGSRGALIGDLETLASCKCVSDVGGGMVEYVTIDNYEVTDKVTAREEAGTPNIPGAIAMGIIAELLMKLDMSVLEEREFELTQYLLAKLAELPEVTIYGSTDLEKVPRGGVVSFNVSGLDHGLVATFLNDYHNIAVRNGCFCAQPYGMALMKCEQGGLPFEKPDPYDLPGMVRASLGVYNRSEDIDSLVWALKDLIANQDDVQKLYTKDEEGNYSRLDGSRLPSTFDLSTCVSNFGIK